MDLVTPLPSSSVDQRPLTHAVELLESPTLAARVVGVVVTLIAERFTVQLIEKVAAQTLTLLGALSGAMVNAIFMDHF